MVEKNKKASARANFRTQKSLPNSMENIIESAKQGQLIVVIGAGVSMGLTNNVVPSWSGLIENGFKYAHRKGRISDVQLTAWESQLASDDIDDLLSAAEFMGRKLGAPDDHLYGRWLQEAFSAATPSNENLRSALKSISAHDIPICTLNYDSLLENVTGLPALQLSDTVKVSAWMRREYSAILHLHGHWENPNSCILGIRDYATTLTNEVRDLVQKSLAAFNHLLFIGCGDTFADPNFSALVGWLRKQLKTSTLQHIALTRESDLVRRNADPTWSGFVEPVSFGAAHDDLAEFLLKKFPLVAPKQPIRKRASPTRASNSILDDYRAFLLRDCGQMTIEGVSADMDTGQRKFDLERLFVPLHVSACPPEFLPSDPDGAAKLEKWQKDNREAMPFGEAIAKHKRLALLALPGGGKTLLLKRLAVAYADSTRRTASTDSLPDLNLLPILIRCREWRDHIRQPIKNLLKNLHTITGQSNLSGLSEALVPLLKTGQVLLLVDGLDEIHSDSDRTTFVEHLESFLEEYKSIRVVVTSREAGFNLVAPSLARFCERWRVAPLADDAITMLCSHWHRLMNGESPAALSESDEVAQTLLRNSALRRLAENPLLLTMLLVVKHGAGGLPPDRVSLYGRAVDVLLDTWNIKGHEPLNTREAVPQLAYVAFQLMCNGKQTATEKELLDLLEEAREKHPSIKRYAKDSPHAFLKRVELRSSLLLEAGHQMETGRMVPFYQFRHLTFQEYLASVAVTEGHYQKYHQDDTVLTPLASHLLAEEWTEVIPMVAVLARKRAEPLLVELIAKGNELRSEIESGAIPEETATSNKKLPGPAGRLVQCFVEEAEASPETISDALQLIAFFAQGCKSSNDWNALCRGPYGEELYSQAWALLISKDWPEGSWLMNSSASIAAHRKPIDYWTSQQGISEIKSLIQSSTKDDRGRGLLIIMGILWNHSHLKGDDLLSKIVPEELIEPFILHEDSDISSIATWSWTNVRRRLSSTTQVSTEILNAFVTHWLDNPTTRRSNLAAYALSCQIGLERDHWTPVISDAQATIIRAKYDFSESSKNWQENYNKSACFFVAFHAKTVWTDEDLLLRINTADKARARLRLNEKNFDSIKIALGGTASRKRISRKGRSSS